jgi:hypothetical protein
MSTGLTYLTIADRTSGAPDLSSVPVVFSSYNEAREYGRWFLTGATDTGEWFNTMVITIWTSGPNDNGYYVVTGGLVVWTAFDV